MIKSILKGVGYTFMTMFGLLLLYCLLFTIGPNGKCIVCTTTTITDTVTGILNGGATMDIIFSLKHHKSYYINRGLGNGLNIDSLQQQLLNNSATISYASPTTHINKLVFNNRVIYSELKH